MAGHSENIRFYREMLRLDPSSKVFEALAEELYAAGEWQEVVLICREGLKYHAEHLRPRVLLGMALMELGEHEESQGILLEVHRTIRESSIVFKLLAEQAALSGESGEAAQFTRIYQCLAGQSLPEKNELKVQESAQASQPQVPGRPPGKLELILSALADKLESRSPDSHKSSILSVSDLDILKKAVMASVD